jgi:hypothetical protein
MRRCREVVQELVPKREFGTGCRCLPLTVRGKLWPAEPVCCTSVLRVQVPPGAPQCIEIDSRCLADAAPRACSPATSMKHCLTALHAALQQGGPADWQRMVRWPAALHTPPVRASQGALRAWGPIVRPPHANQGLQRQSPS